jgi:hypothetical protein
LRLQTRNKKGFKMFFRDLWIRLAKMCWQNHYLPCLHGVWTLDGEPEQTYWDSLMTHYN